MLKRIFVAAIGIPLLLAILYAPGGLPFAGVCFLIGGIGILEMRAAFRQFRKNPNTALALAAFAWLWLSFTMPELSKGRGLGLALIFIVALAAETFSKKPRPVERLSSALLMLAYPGLVLVPLLLRQDTRPITLGGHSIERGAAWLTVAFVMVWITDTGAYFVGRGFGRRKLAPRLSPSKTWEGALGGWLFAAILGGWIGFWGRESLFPGGAASGLLLGMLAGAWGQVGDLVESAMKRELGVKDFGGWLPGHGGVLDRFDSFLFVCPLVYLWSLASPT